MYEPQHFADSHDNAGGFRPDPNSWVSGGGGGGEDRHHLSSPSLRRTLSSLSIATSSGAPPGNVDRVLFNDLVEIVPLVQSLIDQKVNTSFPRRGSVIYTKAPSRESLYKKVIEGKGRNAAQSIPTQRLRDPGDKEQNRNSGNNQDGGPDGFSMLSRDMLSEKDREELSAWRQQMLELEQKLLEKDELLKSAEISKDQMASINAELDELKHQAAVKDSLVQSAQSQLSDTKIRLADKQAVVEKLQWEVMTSNKRVEKLLEDLDTMEGEISSFMLLFEGLSKIETVSGAENYDVTPLYSDHPSLIDDLDETKMQEMEEAREAYIAAVAAAKEKQDEEFLAAAASARFRLQSIVLGSNRMNGSLEKHVEISRTVSETFAA